VESKVIDAESDAVNFQKHAATLDASVRIYASRVDAVHNDTYKMLGTSQLLLFEMECFSCCCVWG